MASFLWRFSKIARPARGFIGHSAMELLQRKENAFRREA
jgi:hypothetical protein